MARKTIDDPEKRQLVREWDKSGLTSSVFAASRGIRPEQLQAWGRAIRGPLKTYSKKPKKQSSSRSIELVELVEDVRNESGASVHVDIELRNGRQLSLSGSWTISQLAELVRVLERD